MVTISDKDKILMSRICAFIFANKSTILYRIIIESHVNSMAESKLGYRLVTCDKPWKHHKMLLVVESEKSHIKEVWSTGRANRQQYLKILTDLRVIAEKPALQLSVSSLTAALGAWLGAKKHGIATRRSAFASRVTEYIGRLKE